MMFFLEETQIPMKTRAIDFLDEVRKGEDEYCRQSQSHVAKDLVVLHTMY
jgi:hypothetical protein